ncbi:MAG: FAD:protein FMN transferase [Actinomycetota bacterium]
MRRVEQIMGTVFSFDVRSDRDPTAALDETVAWLHWVDETFSPYRADSVVSSLQRDELTLDGCPGDVVEVFNQCHKLSAASNGYFTVTPHGALDPCGFVKGWSVERASAQLRARGFVNHAIGGGGDVRASGESGDGSAWRIGIADPGLPRHILAVVAARDLAVATSGTAERGAHVIDPTTDRPATEITSLTVVGPDLGIADGYATAGVAMGAAARDWLETLPEYEAYAINADGQYWSTTEFCRHVAG